MTTRVLALLELPVSAQLVADVLAAAVRHFPGATVVPSADGRRLSIHVVTVDDADPMTAKALAAVARGVAVTGPDDRDG